METIRLHYKGSRSLTKQYFNRQAYVFKKENNFTVDVPSDFAKILLQAGEYEPVTVIKETIIEREPEKDLVCKVCGFMAKSEQGLLVHRSKHTKKEKK